MEDNNTNEEKQVEEATQSSPATRVTPPQPIKKGKKKSPVLLVILILAGLGIFLIVRGMNTSNKDAEASPTPDFTISSPSTPEATSTPEPDRDEISVEVLNGTGISGEAGLLQGKFANLGYSDVEVGNADDSDNETTLVTFSSSLDQSIIDEITKLLEETYQEVDAETESSPDTDVVVVTGLRKGQTAKPSATPTPTPEPTSTPVDESDTTS